MTTNDNDTHDSELKSYLEGDGISATYRQASAEMPPPALDALILRNAREAVQGNAGGKRNSWRGAYQLAASFAVGILITSLYLDRPDELAISQESAVPVTVSLNPQSAAPAPATAQAGAPALATEGVLMEKVLDTQPILNETQPTAIAARASRTVTNIAPVSTGSQIANNAVYDLSRNAPGVLPANQPEQQNRAEVASLEEIIVAGSRIRRADESDVSYRGDRQEWLGMIRSLNDEVASLTAELDNSTARLDEETALFLQAFPDATIGELTGAQEKPAASE